MVVRSVTASLVFGIISLLAGCSGKTSPSGQQVPAPAVPKPRVAAPIQVPPVPHEEIVRKKVIEQPISFCLIHGVHVKSPFHLIQTDYKIVLEGNGSRVLLWEFPKEKLWNNCPKSLPKLPANVTAQSTFAELDARDNLAFVHMEKARLYFTCRNRRVEAARLFTDYVRSLPFVASAEWTEGEDNPERTGQYLLILSPSGEERHLFGLTWDPSQQDSVFLPCPPPPYGFPTSEHLIANSPESKAWIREHSLDPYWDEMERKLEKGVFQLANENGGAHKQWSAYQGRDLIAVGRLLQQEATVERRALEIKRYFRVSNSDKDEWWPLLLELVEHFDESAEMRNWFEEIQ